MANFEIPQPQGEHTEANNALVQEWKDAGHDWWYPINYAHTRLTSLDPDYKITQIKNKFGGLRFYFTLSKNDDALRAQAQRVVEWSEAWVEGYEFKSDRKKK